MYQKRKSTDNHANANILCTKDEFWAWVTALPWWGHWFQRPQTASCPQPNCFSTLQGAEDATGVVDNRELTSSVQPVRPWLSVVRRPADSWHTDSPSSDSDACVPWDTTPRRGCDTAHTSESSEVFSTTMTRLNRRRDDRPYLSTGDTCRLGSIRHVEERCDVVLRRRVLRRSSPRCPSTRQMSHRPRQRR